MRHCRPRLDLPSGADSDERSQKVLCETAARCHRARKGGVRLQVGEGSGSSGRLLNATAPADLEFTLTPGNPKVQKLQAQIDELESALKNENSSARKRV